MFKVILVIAISVLALVYIIKSIVSLVKDSKYKKLDHNESNGDDNVIH